MKSTSKLIAAAMGIILGASSLQAQARMPESLADIARKAREEKEKRAAAATTYTNDTKPQAPAQPQAQPIANPAPPAGYDVKTTPNSWADCPAAGAGLAAMEGGIGHTQWEFDFHPSGNAIQTNGAWIYTATITGKVSITMILPNWVNIPSDSVAPWQTMIANLRQHEEGHVRIVQEVVPQLDGRTITGNGPTQGAAQEDAQRQYRQLLESAVSAHASKQKQYDDVTDHGRKQSAIGGQDVKLVCPNRS